LEVEPEQLCNLLHGLDITKPSFQSPSDKDEILPCPLAQILLERRFSHGANDSVFFVSTRAYFFRAFLKDHSKTLKVRRNSCGGGKKVTTQLA